MDRYWKTTKGVYNFYNHKSKSTMCVELKGEYSTSIRYYPGMQLGRTKTTKDISKEEFQQAFKKAIELLITCT